MINDEYRMTNDDLITNANAEPTRAVVSAVSADFSSAPHSCAEDSARYSINEKGEISARRLARVEPVRQPDF